MDYPYRLNGKLHDTLFLQTKIHKHISHMRDFHGNIKMKMEGWKKGGFLTAFRQEILRT